MVNNKIDNKTTHPDLNTNMQTLTLDRPLKFVTSTFYRRISISTKEGRLQGINAHSESVVNIETASAIVCHRPARYDCPITLALYLPGTP
ncbi:MAG: hypothetical protein NMNS02_03100 [Nitrosomonas sp.]|nr:MAG: hypothetical protein NMNS02_03100 [Nitrosomonas sp.]